MKNNCLKWIAAALMLAVGGSAAQAQTTVGPNRPATVPAAYVITPFGYFHPSCVQHLAPGDVVRHDERVIAHTNGSTTAIPTCGYARYRADGEKVTGDDRGVVAPNISHAWIEDAQATTSSSYAEISAQWSVPPTPTSSDGQTLFYFPGMQDTHDVVTIIQPVLGWNSDYRNSWGIASWNCCTTGVTQEATPQPVSPGDTILGYLFYTCKSGTLSCTTWDIVTWDVQNGKFSQMTNTSSVKQTFNWAFGGVLEVYNIKQCSDYPTRSTYPGSGTIEFGQVLLFNDSFQQITPSWSVQNLAGGLTPQCGYGGSLPAQIILNAN